MRLLDRILGKKPNARAAEEIPERKLMNGAAIAAGSVTTALMQAMEGADKMKSVVIMYETKDDCEEPGGIILSKGQTYADVLWHLEMAKKWAIE